jgi:hypothetical protein
MRTCDRFRIWMARFSNTGFIGLVLIEPYIFSDCVKLLNEEHWVTAGEDGHLAVWGAMKKKPLVIVSYNCWIRIRLLTFMWVRIRLLPSSEKGCKFSKTSPQAVDGSILKFMF